MYTVGYYQWQHKMLTKKQAKDLAREALELVKDRAPAIVDEQILPEAIDEIVHYTGELMGKLTHLNAEDEMSVLMAHGIIRDGLMREMMDQVQKTMLREADKRINKLFKK